MIFWDSRGRSTSPPRRKARVTTGRFSSDWRPPARPAPTPGVTATTTPKLFGRAPFDTAIRERSFGLVRADGGEKPACAVIRAFSSRLAAGEVRFGSAPKVLDLEVDAYYAAPEDNFRRLYDRWLTAPR